MPEFVYPSNAQLQAIAQEKAAALTTADPLFSIMPTVNVDAALLMWEQRDNYVGLQAVRGLGGQPARVNAVGGKRYTVIPGAYGEFATVDETEMTMRRAYGSFATPIDISDLVMERQDQLLSRRIDRIRYIGWTLLSTGTFSVANADGAVLHTDTFSIQSYTASIDWSTTATATPLANLRAIKLLGRGKGVRFDRSARLYLNQTEINNLLNNTNANDFGGRRVNGGNTLNNLNDLNAILAADDLPQIIAYDEGYLNEAGSFNLFIADGRGVLIGSRPTGETIADFALTRNVNAPGGVGAYSKVKDDEDDVPRNIEVHDGMNGAPRIYYPGSVVRLNI